MLSTMIVGIVIFALIFAINSSIHSYLVSSPLLSSPPLLNVVLPLPPCLPRSLPRWCAMQKVTRSQLASASTTCPTLLGGSWGPSCRELSTPTSTRRMCLRASGLASWPVKLLLPISFSCLRCNLLDLVVVASVFFSLFAIASLDRRSDKLVQAPFPVFSQLSSLTR